MSESSDTPRWDLIRASLLFQLKLLADGLRDFLLVPVSIGATIAGLLRSGEDPEREFEQVLDFGRQTERWINLFGTHEPFEEAGQAGNLDQLVTRAEQLVREQAREGDVPEQAAAALHNALETLRRRAREARESGLENPPENGEKDARETDRGDGPA
ncbi:MAG: hypothetical protein V2I57_12250 [Xanthomonadales bacterium]|jgi:hypothetical protein|nr:hypothetical protein [Xanthomonadales bacterium]